ncbi:hypothetical protein ACFOEP_13270 [Microbacterium amylolyticum]|uniref:hypothetical protein n=1 Tax=Microbacterium amylolyticum TaxID=936337 RepID=UPI00360E5B49
MVFGGLFLGALLGVALVMAPAGGVDPVATILEIVSSAQFWVPVVVFWLTFWLFGVFVNRSRWWTWVVFGVLISAATWAGFLIAGVIGAPFWTVTIEEGLASVQGALLAVPGLIAFILSREITIWFGGWAASRGAKVTRQNKEALEEYERIMEEGPKAP